MRKIASKLTGCLLVGTILVSGSAVHIYGAANDNTVAVNDTLSAGAVEAAASSALVSSGSLSAGIFGTMAQYLEESSATATQLIAEREAASQVSENEVPVVASEYTDIAIAQVDNYVNVRSEANTESEVVGKLYDNSAATVLETTDDGWYRITSGNVTGYVKCEYVVTGDEELAKSVSTKYATVTTTTLYVRSEPSTEASVMMMLPEGDDLVVVDDSQEGWVLVTTEAGDGYVSTDYVTLTTEYVTAESKEEEAARLAKEAAEREAADEAAAAARKAAQQKAAASSSASNTAASNTAASTPAASAPAETPAAEAAPVEAAPEQTYSAPSGGNGQAVVNYACQFVGNPYVYGGTSLTNGADCSGFVMSVYAAFGVSLPHSSSGMRSVGYGVSVSEIQPGDIICYSGHVAIYVGNNTVVHASTPSSGIKYTSPITYKSIICVRRIF